jgi:hypothetical protein
LHNKWLRKPDNKMTSLYEATVDDMICAFMQMSNYISWLKGGSTCKGRDSKSLKLKVVARNRDPNLLAKAMKPYPREKHANTWGHTLEDSKLFRSMTNLVLIGRFFSN